MSQAKSLSAIDSSWILLSAQGQHPCAKGRRASLTSVPSFGIVSLNLDKITGESIIRLFKRLAADKGLAILLTTHNTLFGHEVDRAITLEDGRIVKEEELRATRGPTAHSLPEHEQPVQLH
jgi:hypothetical protein